MSDAAEENKVVQLYATALQHAHSPASNTRKVLELLQRALKAGDADLP